MPSHNPPDRPRPKIITGQSPRAETNGTAEVVQETGLNLQGSSMPIDSARLPRHEHFSKDGQPSGPQAHLNHTKDPDSIATSPRLRQFRISASEGSPLETLPALHASPQRPSNSPSSLQSLPSIQSTLGTALADGPPPSLPGRQGSFSVSNAINSPPQDYSSPRGPPPYAPLSSRTNGSFPATYQATEPSPASAHSGPSPRDPFAPGQTPRSTSPPARFGPRQYSGTQGFTPSDVETPISASSQASYKTLGTEPSPVSERTMLDTDRPILPPLTNGPFVGGGFKCEHPGCTAAPFQTQYLLKYVLNTLDCVARADIL